MGAAADGDTVGVAGDKAHRIDRHAEPFGDELREACLVALTLGRNADDELDEAFGRHRDLGLLARHTGRNVDIDADADAAMLATSFRFGAAAPEARPVAELERQIDAANIVAVVVFDAERIFVWQLRLGDEIAAADGSAVEAELAGGDVDQPLHDEDHLRPAGAAIRPRRRGVAERGAGAKMRRRHAIDARHHLHALLHHGEVRGVAAEIADIGAAHG